MTRPGLSLGLRLAAQPQQVQALRCAFCGSLDHVLDTCTVEPTPGAWYFGTQRAVRGLVAEAWETWRGKVTYRRGQLYALRLHPWALQDGRPYVHMNTPARACTRSLESFRREFVAVAPEYTGLVELAAVNRELWRYPEHWRAARQALAVASFQERFSWAVAPTVSLADARERFAWAQLPLGGPQLPEGVVDHA